MKFVPASTRTASGVTLVELLLCVALIAVITTLAFPFFTNADAARDARDRRNAQTLCSVSHIIQSTGIRIVDEGDAKLDILNQLRQGVTIDRGPLRGKTISVPDMGEDEVASAARYLDIQDGELVYNAAVDG